MEDGIHITNKQGYASAGTSLKIFNKIRSHIQAHVSWKSRVRSATGGSAVQGAIPVL
jgi:hypothetical protein